MKQNDTNNQQHDPDVDSGSSSIIETEADNKKAAPAANAADPEHRKSYRRSWRSSGPVTKVMAVSTAVIATATVLYMIFSGWQLYEIHSGAEETRKMAQAARDNANAAERAVAEAEKNRLTTERIAKESGEASKTASEDASKKQDRLIAANEQLAGAAGRQADASKESAHAAGQAANAAERSAQFAQQSTRPFIGIEAITLARFEVDQRIKFDLVVTNAGNVPASDVVVYIVADPEVSPVPNPNPRLDLTVPIASKGFILPKQPTTWPCEGLLVSADVKKRVIEGTAHLIVYFHIVYTDWQHGDYWTNYCVIYRPPPLNNFQSTNVYGDAK